MVVSELDGAGAKHVYIWMELEQSMFTSPYRDLLRHFLDDF
jgi:hypothetical protein